MRFETKSLRSKLARRIFLLFITCALIPVGTLAILSFYQVSGQLRDQSRLQLGQAVKLQGMSTLERLEMLDREMQVLVSQRTSGTEFHDHFSSVELIDGHSRVTTLLGQAFRPPTLSEEQRTHLDYGKPLLRTSSCGNGRDTCVELLRFIETGSEKELAVGEINLNYLWGADRLPSTLLICVFDQQRIPVFCSPENVAEVVRNNIPIQGQSSSGVFEWTDRKNSYDAAYWLLFLNPEFHSSGWTVVLSQSHEDALAPMLRFRKLFPYVMVLTLWVVILLSLVQIRRTMVPLEKLQIGTKQLAAQHFDSTVQIQSDDEFQDLARSFNSMSLQLGRQFHALRTINEIDRAILDSLDRSRMIVGALSHMPQLIAANCFAVALFGNQNDPVELVISTRHSTESSQQQIARKSISPLTTGDADTIRSNPDVLIFDNSSSSGPPHFLQALENENLSKFIVFPIFLDRRPYAALVCGWRKAVEINSEEIQYARQVADQLAVAFSNVRLLESLEQFHWGTLTALARAIDAKSSWTAGHSERVTAMAVRIARTMGLPAEDIQTIERAGLLHDIGKIGIPAAVLDKAGKLDPDELSIMREHVNIGLRILEPIPAFKETLPIVAQHHEWINGAGYPKGLKGDEISLQARIFAVADCYDALISDRPYRRGLPENRALELIKSGTGTQFDPAIVEAFLKDYDRTAYNETESQTELADSSVTTL